MHFVVCAGVLIFATVGHSAPWFDTYVCPSVSDVDYIVVGGGSAGSVVASRLSENPTLNVVLLEAGRNAFTETDYPIDVPFLTRKLMSTDINWDYTTERQTNSCLAYQNQAARVPSGRGLGGTSNINSMIYTRGNRFDYDRLDSLGIVGWSYDDVLPTFKRMETYQSLHRREDHKFHGFQGHQTVSSPVYKSPLAEAFLQAGQELGHFQVDCNAEYQTGFTAPPVNIRDGIRWGSYRSYLDPALGRPNLRVITEALVSKVIFDSKKAIGVNYEYKNRQCTIYSKNEVIVSAGALRSPQLLMLSGVGPRDYLDQFEIPLVVDLPGVGQNLRDHVLASGIQFSLNQSVGLKFSELDTEENRRLWDMSGTGPLTSSNGVEGIAFFPSVNSNIVEPPDHPAIEISMFTDKGLDPRTLDENYRNSFVMYENDTIIAFIPILLQTKSKGRVTLRSANVREAPIIDPKYLSHPDDVQKLLEAVEIALSIGRTKNFRKYGAKQIPFGYIPGCDVFAPESNEFWTCYLSRFATSSYHFTGTNKMASKTDPMRVVDSELRVYGVSGLRVADLSVLPLPISGHTHAVALMVGERAAEFILQSNRQP